MKLPAEVHSIQLVTEIPLQSFPPLGFWPCDDFDFGNGDYFGLYWPIGKEDLPPLIAETLHDCGMLIPQFSTLKRFLCAIADPETESGDSCFDFPQTPNLADDPFSPLACFEHARWCLKQNDIDTAIESLETSVQILPEYTDALSLLSSTYRSQGKIDDAIRIGLRAVISPPSFGERPVAILRWLDRQDDCPEDCLEDPIWLERHQLELRFGEMVANDDYRILLWAIETYLQQENVVAAMTLMQTYAELMCRETTAFQERYDFDSKRFFEWQVDVSKNVHGHSRLPTF